MTRPVGSRQKAVLSALVRRGNGVWWRDCGWYWGTHSETAKILDALVKRGLVTKEPGVGWTNDRYTITDEGKKVADAGQS